MELLRQGREEAVAELAVADPRALRPLTGRLWDPDPGVRRSAAGAIGRAAAAHPGLGLEVIRRLMWALNDESATNGVCGIPALGEIGYRSPRTLGPFVEPLVTAAGDEGLRLEVLRALARVAEAAPELIVPHLERLAAVVDESQDEEGRAFRRLTRIARGSDGEAH